MSIAFQDKVVWVVGASSGIGKGIALEFARNKSKLILSARRIEELETVKRECEFFTTEVEILPLDLSKEETHVDAAKKAASYFGPVDVLVHSGGITSRSLAHATKGDVDRRVMDVNFFGVISLTRAVLPSMMERKKGHIVVITSVVGKIGTQLRSAYAASKHALHGWFDSLRVELDPYNIDVTLVCPGFIATELTMNALTEDGTPLKQMNQAQVNGMSTQVFAEKLLPKLAARKQEIAIGGKEIAAIYVKRFFPGLLHKILLRTKVT